MITILVVVVVVATMMAAAMLWLSIAEAHYTEAVLWAVATAMGFTSLYAAGDFLKHEE